MNALFRLVKNTDGNTLDITADEVKRRFASWVKTRDERWLETQKSDFIIQQFIGSFEGLDATISDDQAIKVILLLRPSVYDAKYKEA